MDVLSYTEKLFWLYVTTDEIYIHICMFCNNSYCVLSYRHQSVICCIANICSDILVSAQNALGDMIGTCIVDHILRVEVTAQAESSATDVSHHYSSHSASSGGSLAEWTASRDGL